MFKHVTNTRTCTNDCRRFDYSDTGRGRSLVCSACFGLAHSCVNHKRSCKLIFLFIYANSFHYFCLVFSFPPVYRSLRAFIVVCFYLRSTLRILFHAWIPQLSPFRSFLRLRVLRWLRQKSRCVLQWRFFFCFEGSAESRPAFYHAEPFHGLPWSARPSCFHRTKGHKSIHGDRESERSVALRNRWCNKGWDNTHTYIYTHTRLLQIRPKWLPNVKKSFVLLINISYQNITSMWVNRRVTGEYFTVERLNIKTSWQLLLASMFLLSQRSMQSADPNAASVCQHYP